MFTNQGFKMNQLENALNGITRKFSFLLSVAILSGCSGGADLSKVSPAPGYPPADGPGEKMQPDEAKAATAIGDAIEQGLTRRALVREQTGPADGMDKLRPYIRDAHPKAHGCVKANFQLADDLPAELTEGVFQPGGKYCSWVRFSNSNEDPDRSDVLKDGRGMAIKLLGVEGETLLDVHKDAGTQDFIMISNPVFFIDKAANYATVVQQQNQDGGPSMLKLLSAIGVKGAINAAEITSLLNRNPLQGEYWSMVPYQFGTGDNAKVIKFKSQPCGYDQMSEERKTFRDPEIPSDYPPNFLRQALADSLSGEKTPCMEFLVQFQGPGMEVEDALTEWSPKESPFRKVAELHFPAPQNFNTLEQNLACEDMSYTPWHALPEHKPLGAINRIRKVVYERISNFRHENNQAPIQEPPQFQLDDCVDGQWLN